MNATERIEAKGLKFEVGQEVVIPSYPSVIRHTLEAGEYVVLVANTLQVFDVADNWETAETYSLELGDGQGYVLVLVTEDGQTVQQGWRDVVSDCWDLPN